MKLKLSFVSLTFCLFATSSMVYAKDAPAAKSLYFVKTNQATGVFEPNQVITMMDNLVLPGLTQMAKLQADKTILAGGLYAAGRGGVMIMEASSIDEVDRILHTIPLWPLLEWEVTPLTSYNSRLALEKELIGNMRKMMVK